MTIKLYASESGFLYGDQVVTTYPSGCMRHIAWVANNRDLRPDIKPEFMKVGAVMERENARRLDGLGLDYQLEIPLTYKTASGIEVRGRCDVMLPGSIQETKATFSKSGIYSVFRKGEYKVTYLAQLVRYMVVAEVDKGEMIHGAFSYSPRDVFTGTEFSLVETKTFPVAIHSDGSVSVQGNVSAGFSVQATLDHIEHAAQASLDKRVWPERPLGHANKFGSPCFYCELKPVCDKFDSGKLSQADSFNAVRPFLGDKDE